MDEKDLIFKEYKMYTEQKENFVSRNFSTNKFYMTAIFVAIIAMIYTNDVMFINKLTATLLFAVIGLIISTLWWMNVDSFNTLIKIKYSSVIEKLEEKLPAKPFQEENKGVRDFKERKLFLFSDIQKLAAIIMALFFFVIFICEVTPLTVSVFNKLAEFMGATKSIGI